MRLPDIAAEVAIDLCARSIVVRSKGCHRKTALSVQNCQHSHSSSDCQSAVPHGALRAWFDLPPAEYGPTRPALARKRAFWHAREE